MKSQTLCTKIQFNTCRITKTMCKLPPIQEMNTMLGLALLFILITPIIIIIILTLTMIVTTIMITMTIVIMMTAIIITTNTKTVFHVNRAKRIDKEIFEGIHTEKVDELSFDIGGLRHFQLKCDPQKIMNSSKDGRPRQTWCTSSSSQHRGIRRRARCGGSWRCQNPNCLFLKEKKKNCALSVKKK